MPALRSSTETVFAAINTWLNESDVAAPTNAVFSLVQELAAMLDNERENAYARGYDAGVLKATTTINPNERSTV